MIPAVSARSENGKGYEYGCKYDKSGKIFADGFYCHAYTGMQFTLPEVASDQKRTL